MARTTYDLTGGKNQIIEYISIDEGVKTAALYRKLPPKVCDIRTILHYRGNGMVSGGKNVIDEERVKSSMKKGCWKCDSSGHPSKNQKLANRRGKVSKNKKFKWTPPKEPPDPDISL